MNVCGRSDAVVSIMSTHIGVDVKLPAAIRIGTLESYINQDQQRQDGAKRVPRTSGTRVRIDMYPQATWAVEALWTLWALVLLSTTIHTEDSATRGFLEVRSTVIDGQFGDI
jgi:hypothetical protein